MGRQCNLDPSQVFEVGRLLGMDAEISFCGFDARVVDVYEKKGGALQFVVAETRVTNQRGEHIADVLSSTVQR